MNNLLTEISKMKNLFNAEHGNIIFEQTSPEQLIANELKNTAGRDLNAFTNAIKSIKDQKTFWNVNSVGDIFKMIGKFNTIMSDPEKLNPLKTHINNLGIKFDVSNKFFDQISGGGIKHTSTGNSRQDNINNMVCSADKSGIIRAPQSSFNGQKLDDYISSQTVTVAELNAAKQSCPKKNLANSPVTARGTNTSTNKPAVQQKFKQSAQQLDPNSSGTMDAKSLEQILKTLEGANPSGGATPTPGGTPDVAALQSALQSISA